MSHWTRTLLDTLRFARGHASRAFTAAHTGTHGACHASTFAYVRMRAGTGLPRLAHFVSTRHLSLAIRGLIATYKHIFYELRLNRESILSRSS